MSAAICNAGVMDRSALVAGPPKEGDRIIKWLGKLSELGKLEVSFELLLGMFMFIFNVIGRDAKLADLDFGKGASRSLFFFEYFPVRLYFLLPLLAEVTLLMEDRVEFNWEVKSCCVCDDKAFCTDNGLCGVANFTGASEEPGVDTGTLMYGAVSASTTSGRYGCGCGCGCATGTLKLLCGDWKLLDDWGANCCVCFALGC